MSDSTTDYVPLAKRLHMHEYNGLCPDSVEGWETRDPACQACQLLDQLTAVIAHVTEDRAHMHCPVRLEFQSSREDQATGGKA